MRRFHPVIPKWKNRYMATAAGANILIVFCVTTQRTLDLPLSACDAQAGQECRSALRVFSLFSNKSRAIWAATGTFE
jgi:hypothetical protein